VRLFGDAPEERAVIHRVISEFDSYSRSSRQQDRARAFQWGRSGAAVLWAKAELRTSAVYTGPMSLGSLPGLNL
jgi:hypothetical protein